jgi:cytochrome c biogenesis protein CcmG/thiol:disulfide interchange protein DsbE
VLRQPSFTSTFAIILCLIFLAGCERGARPVRIGSTAPDFTVESVSMRQFRGQIVVLNFWATWCRPCVEEMPSLQEMQKRMKANGVTVLAVSVDVDENAYRRFLNDHRVDLLTARDPNQKISALYGTFKFPETYIIDRNGIMRRKFLGPVDWTAPDIAEFLQKL